MLEHGVQTLKGRHPKCVLPAAGDEIRAPIGPFDRVKTWQCKVSFRAT